MWIFDLLQLNPGALSLQWEHKRTVQGSKKRWGVMTWWSRTIVHCLYFCLLSHLTGMYFQSNPINELGFLLPYALFFFLVSANLTRYHVKVHFWKCSGQVNRTKAWSRSSFPAQTKRVLIGWMRSELTIRLLCGKVPCCCCFRKNTSPTSATEGQHQWGWRCRMTSRTLISEAQHPQQHGITAKVDLLELNMLTNWIQ